MDSTINGFSNMHPLSNFVFFLLELSIVVFCANPFLQLCSMCCALLYLLFLKGKKIFKTILGLLAAAVIAMIVNPLFSHQGATILSYFPDGNPLTLESIIYGAGMGVMLMASLLWFLVLNEVMTTQKWIHLFGKAVPSLGLLFSLVLHFVPKLRKQQKEMKELNKDVSSITLFSMLVTWGLETSVDTADSMAARGYGIGNRSSYGIYHFAKKDAVFIGVCIILGMVVFAAVYFEGIYFYYYPVICFGGKMPLLAVSYAAFVIYSMLPLLLGMKENVKWKYLESRI